MKDSTETVDLRILENGKKGSSVRNCFHGELSRILIFELFIEAECLHLKYNKNSKPFC